MSRCTAKAANAACTRARSQENIALRVLRARRRPSWWRSHPKDAELRRGDRCVEACRQGECKHVACLCRIEDAIVPQSRGGVVRGSLQLVLVQNRLPNLLLLFR